MCIRDSALCKLPFGNTTIDSKKGRLSVTVLNRLRKQWEAARAAFIDEVSMVAADKLHQTEVRIKSAKNLLRAFGGLGMTLSGDFLQLPPVDPSDTSKSLATKLQSIVEDKFNEEKLYAGFCDSIYDPQVRQALEDEIDTLLEDLI